MLILVRTANQIKMDNACMYVCVRPVKMRMAGSSKLTPAPYEKAQTSEEMIYMQAVRSSRQLSTEVLRMSAWFLAGSSHKPRTAVFCILTQPVLSSKSMNTYMHTVQHCLSNERLSLFFRGGTRLQHTTLSIYSAVQSSRPPFRLHITYKMMLAPSDKAQVMI